MDANVDLSLLLLHRWISSSTCWLTAVIETLGFSWSQSLHTQKSSCRSNCETSQRPSAPAHCGTWSHYCSPFRMLCFRHLHIIIAEGSFVKTLNLTKIILKKLHPGVDLVLNFGTHVCQARLVFSHPVPIRGPQPPVWPHPASPLIK